MLNDNKWRSVLLLCVLAGGILTAVPAIAVTTNLWTLTTREDFLAGSLDNLVVTSEGVLALAPATEELTDVTADHIWRVVPGRGRLQDDVFLTSGMPGRVLRVTGNTSEIILEGKDTAYYALAAGADAMYIGAFPGGTIWRYRNGVAEVWTELPEKYIWDMACGDDGNLYVACGLAGNLYRVDRGGDAELILASASDHLVTLALDADGTVYAGSSIEGLVYAVDPQGNSRVIANLPQDEIAGMAVTASGDLLVAVNAPGGKNPRMPSPPPAARPQPDAAENGEKDEEERAPEELIPGDIILPGGAAPLLQEDSGHEEEGEGNGGAEPSGRPSGPNPLEMFSGYAALYRLTPEGRYTLLYCTDQDFIYDILMVDDNEIWFATGGEGKVAGLLLSEEISKDIFDLSAGQVLCMTADAHGNIYFATGNGGHLYRLSGATARTGSYTAKVFNAGLPASWGNFQVDSDQPDGTSVLYRSRSGNTDTPDTTWSEWSGYQAGAGPIGSPPAQFLEVEALLQTEHPDRTPVVREIISAYRVMNQEPLIMAVTVDGQEREGEGGNDGKAEAGSFTERIDGNAPGNGRRIAWQASDPDNDDLSFNVYIREERATAWLWLNSERPDLTSPQFLWNTSYFPDGAYYIRLVASDRTGNPPGAGLQAQKVSGPFLVDHSLPEIIETVSEVARGRVTVRATAIDAGSFIASFSYSVDAGKWVCLAPADGFYDSRREHFTWEIDDLPAGEHLVTLRVTDRLGNVGLHKLMVTVRN